jgi:hypothetical protein
MSLAGFFGKSAFEGQTAHPPGQGFAIIPWMRAKHNTAVPPLRSADAALTGPAGVFLDPRLASAAGNLASGFGIVGALTLVPLIDNQGLVHQSGVHGHVKDSIIQFDAAYGIACLVFNWKFHNVEISYQQVLATLFSRKFLGPSF